MDLASSPVWTFTISHAVGGTFTLTFGGQTTAPIAYAAWAADVKAAIKALNLANVSDVVVNRAGDTFTVGFVGGETMTVPAPTANAAGLVSDSSGTAASITTAAWAQSLAQVVDVHGTTGTIVRIRGTNGWRAPVKSRWACGLWGFVKAILYVFCRKHGLNFI